MIGFLAAGVHGQVLQPPQPATGPGGSDYPFHRVVAQRYHVEQPTGFWIFEPADPTPKTAPVIIFCHGWSAFSPSVYGAWIDHLVKRGNIVIYPQYQDSIQTALKLFTRYAQTGILDAFKALDRGDHVKPQLDKVAAVGHSMGGAMAANMAAWSTTGAIPLVKAVTCVEPDNRASVAIFMPFEDLSKIPKGTLMQIIVGDRDTLAKDITATEMMGLLKQLPPSDLNYITIRSDDHGLPPIVATHLAPLALREDSITTRPFAPRPGSRMSAFAPPDAFDFYGPWKLFDALTDAAFFGKNRDVALGNTPAQTSMGTWSDGTPITPMVVSVPSVSLLDK